MIKFNNLRFVRLIGIFAITLITFTSCVQEADIKIVDPEVKATFDAELEAVLDLMEDDSSLALEKLDDLIADAESIESRYYSGSAKWYKAYIYDEIIGDVSEAYRHYNEALKDVLQTDDSSLKVQIYNNLGILYRFYGEYDRAISNYEAALKLKDDLSVRQLSDLYYNYGVALKLKGDDSSFTKAEQAFTQSLEHAKQIEYNSNIASVNNQIGLMYKAISNYEMARIAYENTIKTYVGDPDMHEYVGKAYHGIGVTYMEEKNADAAIRAFAKALEYKRNSGSVFITKYDLGTILLREERSKEAIAVWKEALKEKHDKNSVEQVQIYSDLTSALKSNNQYEEALVYSQIYNTNIQDIIQEDDKYKSKSDQILFANVVNEYDAFNQTVPFFSRPSVILVMSLVTIVLVYLLLVVYYRSRSRKEVTEVVSKIQTEFLDIKVD
ncbi:MAG: tetratricopeptide repeat protein [Cyclobacteriaceae bacterium]